MADQQPEEPDALDEVTSVIHIALPIVAAILMFYVGIYCHHNGMKYITSLITVIEHFGVE